MSLRLLNPKLVIDWRKKQQTRAAVRVEIEKELDGGLPDSYTRKLYLLKCQLVFQHFYDNYLNFDFILELHPHLFPKLLC